MARLIDADALIAEIIKGNTHQIGDYAITFDYGVMEAINNAPTIDAVPVRHGRWVETYSQGCWHYDCPFCDDGYATKQREKKPVKYCCNCGAKMDGGAEDEKL